MAINPKATSELDIFNDDVGDATSPPDFMNRKYGIRKILCHFFREDEYLK